MSFDIYKAYDKANLSYLDNEGIGRCLQSWSLRCGSCPTFSQSKLWYVIQVLPLAFARELERKVGSFMWLGRLERFEFEELYSPIKLGGGLPLPNIQAKRSALLLKKLLRILDFSIIVPLKQRI